MVTSGGLGLSGHGRNKNTTIYYLRKNKFVSNWISTKSQNGMALVYVVLHGVVVVTLIDDEARSIKHTTCECVVVSLNKHLQEFFWVHFTLLVII